MYSLKQSHGAVEKKYVVYMFSQKETRKRERRCVAGLPTRRMSRYFGIRDTGMFSLTVMLCDDDGSWQSVGCLDGLRALGRSPTREVTGDGVLFPQSDSPICRVV